MYSPYDFNQTIAHRAEYVEERLKSGAPVVAFSCAEGVLLAAPKREQRKIFEIYDRLIYSALGNQADVEAVRLSAIDFAHQEGFVRAPADVSIQRLVGFAISPVLKRAFSDPATAPHVLRAVFAEVGKTPEDDLFYILNYDGEFSIHHNFAVVSGNDDGQEKMQETLKDCDPHQDLEAALKLAGKTLLAAISGEESEEENPLQQSLEKGELDAAILERNSTRESTFRRLEQ
jgi:proteasome alpha subunit